MTYQINHFISQKNDGINFKHCVLSHFGFVFGLHLTVRYTVNNEYFREVTSNVIRVGI